MGKYFGTDGIRGKVNQTITSDLIDRIGKGAGLFMLRNNGEHRHQVFIGKDTRLSNYTFEPALSSGFTSVGADVVLTGPIPMTAVGVLTNSMRCDLGVMLSAPSARNDENGVTFFGPDGKRLSSGDEALIEDYIEATTKPGFTKRLATPDTMGRARREKGAQQRYVEHVKMSLPRALSLADMRVVVDCANGAAYKTAPSALWELGAEVCKINIDPSGLNINVDCGAYHTHTLAAEMRRLRADAGIALDGGGEKVVLMDEKCREVDQGHLKTLLAQTKQNIGSDWPADDQFILALQGLALLKIRNKPATQVFGQPQEVTLAA